MHLVAKNIYVVGLFCASSALSLSLSPMATFFCNATASGGVPDGMFPYSWVLSDELKLNLEDNFY